MKFIPLACTTLGLALLPACAGPAAVAPAPQRPAPSTPTAQAPACTLGLAESWPLETSLDHADIPDAREVWPAMIARARTTVDVASFYVSASGAGALEPTLQALQAAAARGVRVRVLLDAKLSGQYEESIHRLQAMTGISVLVWDAEKQIGGVHHAKYLVIDGEQLFVGSQNLDDRSLEHIEELGVGGACEPLARSLGAVFESDWHLAQGATDKPATGAPPEPWPRDIPVAGGGTATLTASPRGWIPANARWDLDALVQIAGEAKRTLEVQMLTFRPRFLDGTPFVALVDALAGAASRGVRVRLMVSDWMKKEQDQADLRDIAAKGVEVRVIHIPPWSGGDVPFGRVAHAKLMVADSGAAWVGTSNGEGDYFTKGRNVGVVLRGGALPARAGAWFEDGWGMAKAIGQ